MNFRLTAALFAAIFVLGAVLLVMSFIDDKAAAADSLVEELTKAAVKADEVEVVEIERPGTTGKLVFRRAGPDKWVIDEPVKATADRFAVTGVVDALFRAKPTTYTGLSTNPSVHGLEPPSLRVTLKKGDTASTVNVGEVTAGGAKSVAFVTTSANKRPIAVPRSAVDSLLKDPAAFGKAGDNAKWTTDYRSKQIFGIDSRRVADVTAVKLTNKDKTLELSRTGDEWKFVSPANWGGADTVGDTSPTAAGFTGVNPVVTALTALTADEFIEKPADLKEYGLDAGNPDMVRVELRTKDATDVVFIGKGIPAQPPAPSTKWFVKINDEPSVIRANGTKLEALVGLVADPNPIRDRTLLSVAKERIDAIDLTVGGQTVKLRKTGGVPQWKLYGGPGDPPQADAKQIDAMLNVLAERRTIRDFPPPNDAFVSGPELKVEVKLWADGVETDAKADAKAEPKLKGNPIVVQIGRQDGDKFHTRRTRPDGSKMDFTLPERIPTGGATVPVTVELLPTLRKDRLALLDPALPSFSPFNAMKLTIAEGPKVTELDKAEDPASPLGGKWTFAKPDPMKGRTADTETMLTDVLGTLARQSASKYVAEAPSDADLAKWGLDPKAPRLKVAVGFKATDAEKERTYLLGNDVGDGNVYAKVDGRAAVFTLPKLVFDKLASSDLRDKTAVKFDKAKVKGVRFRAWREQSGGKMQTPAFDKKDGTWTARAGGPAPDPTKLNGLLNVLDGLRAKTLVAGGAHPTHKFPPETEAGFEVTIELDGAPEVIVNIGGETADGKDYFGFSNTLPAGEQIFTVPVELFKSYKTAGPSAVTVGK